MEFSWDVLRERAFEAIDHRSEAMIELSERLADNPEIAFQEHRAVEWISEVFAGMGFSIEKPYGGLETAFRARLVHSSKGPNLGFLVEYDALPELGHACGHNTKGASTWGAVAGILAAMPELPGAITVVGTPAEETGGGKIIMANEGAFDDLSVALALSVAPTNMTGLRTLAAQEFVMTFQGRAAHAEARPGEGRNALTACVATFSLVDGLRAGFASDARVNGIVLQGGESTGAIPERAVAVFNVACLDEDNHLGLVDQIHGCAEAGSRATGCTVDIEPRLLYRPMRLNRPLIRLIRRKMQEIGLEVCSAGFGGGTGRTDLGNVSHVVPVDTVWIGIGNDLMPHTPQYLAACRSEAGHRAIINGARVGALCGLEIFNRPQTLQEIQEEFES
ncbi:MAG: amidohydrolase [bacterium]